MKRAHDFLAKLPQWCRESSKNVIRVQLTVNVSPEVDADDEEVLSPCAELCPQKRVSRIEKCWAVKKKSASSSG